MKLTIKNIYKKISNLPDEMRFNKLKKHSAEPDFTEFHELAECYHKGIGTRRNYKQALKWYIKEAVTGNADAQYELGMRYWMGEKLVGGEQNEAMRWIEMAANTGNKRAKAFILPEKLTWKKHKDGMMLSTNGNEKIVLNKQRIL